MKFLHPLLPAILFSLTLQACAQENPKTIQTNTSSEMQNKTTLEPVQNLIEAMASENAELIRAQFAPTATQAYGADGTMKSPDETKKWIESDIINRKGKVLNPKYTIEGENVVVVTGQYESLGYTNKANFLFTVENGQITSWRMRY